MDVLFEPNAMLKVRAKRDYASISLFLFIRGGSWQPERGNGLGKVSGPVMGLWTPQPVSLFLLLFFWFAMPSPCLGLGKNWTSRLGADHRRQPVARVHGMSPVGAVGIAPATSGSLIEAYLLSGAPAASWVASPSTLPVSEDPTGSYSDFSLPAITIWNNKKNK